MGHKFTENGIQTTDNFQNKILHIKTPTTKKQVRLLLGLFNYYAKFIPNYNTKVKPLIELTKKYQPTQIIWNSECEKSLQQLTEAFSTTPILDTIKVDDKLVLATDASSKVLVHVSLRNAMILMVK